MNQILVSCLKESLEIIGIVFVLMVLIEIFILKYKKLLIKLAQSNSFLSYIVSATFGIIPNCTTTFAMDSLYMTGYLSFGALVATMISAIDDVGLYVFSFAIEGKIKFLTVIIFFMSLFILGIIGGKIADFIAQKFKWKFRIKCEIVKHEKEEFKFRHFIREHIFEHIIKKHIWKIFLWMFLALFVIGIFPDFFTSANFKDVNLFYLLLISVAIGLLPTPSPNIIFITLFSQGLIPFSVLLTNSIVQDGHGLLPILGYSFKDAVKVKIYKAIFALVTGILIFSLGY